MNRLRDIALLLIAVSLVGCSTFELEGAGAITPDSKTGSETVHGSLYGFYWRPTTVEKCGKDHLFRVEYHTNAALILASVVTLGLYVPTTVEWWCTSAQIDDEDEEAWDPAAE